MSEKRGPQDTQAIILGQPTTPEDILAELMREVRQVLDSHSPSSLTIAINACLVKAGVARARASMRRLTNARINTAVDRHLSLRRAFTGIDLTGPDFN